MVPAGAAELEFFSSRAFSEVQLMIRDKIRYQISQSLLGRSARSDPFSLTGPVGPAGMWSTARRYLQLGFIRFNRPAFSGTVYNTIDIRPRNEVLYL